MTPLGVRRALLYQFPEFKDIKVVRLGWGHTRAYCQYREAPVDDQKVADVVAHYRALGTQFECVQVAQLPDHDADEDSRLRQTRLPRDVVEDASTTGPGLSDQLTRKWAGVVLGILGNARMSIIVARGTSTEIKEEILAEARVLLAADVDDLRIEDESVVGSTPRVRRPPTTQLTTRVQTQFDADRALLDDHLQDVLEGGSLPGELRPLPSGSATVAKPTDGIENLIHRLSLYRTVYLELTPDQNLLLSTIGTSVDDLFKALPSGRIVPVFGSMVSQYPADFVERIFDAGAPRIVLPGEARLRSLGLFARDTPAFVDFAQMDDEVRQFHAILRSKVREEPRLALLLAYFDRLAAVAANARVVARGAYPLSAAYDGLGQFFDDVGRRGLVNLPDRALEFSAALDLHYTAEAFSASPMCLAGHYLEPFLTIVRAADPRKALPLTFDDPAAVGEVLLGITGMSVAEFASAFKGADVERMHELMQSPRWWEGRAPTDVIADFNREVRHINGSSAPTSTAVLTTSASAFLTGATSLVVGLGLALASRLLETVAPHVSDRLIRFVTRASKEGVLLAKIRRRLT
jgi:hypothetical protein